VMPLGGGERKAGEHKGECTGCGGESNGKKKCGVNKGDWGVDVRRE